VLVTAIWGATFVMVKGAVAAFPVFAFLALRFALAWLALLPLWAWVRHRQGGGGAGGGGAGRGGVPPRLAGDPPPPPRRTRREPRLHPRQHARRDAGGEILALGEAGEAVNADQAAPGQGALMQQPEQAKGMPNRHHLAPRRRRGPRGRAEKAEIPGQRVLGREARAQRRPKPGIEPPAMHQ